MIQPILVDKQSPFLGQECALCRQPFAPGDEIVLCPVDESRHHTLCWRSNGNKCTAYGCSGRGLIRTATATPRNEPRRASRITVPGRSEENQRRSKVRVLPSSSLGCAQSCLLLSIAAAILLFAIGCFGLWAIADYILLEILQWPYRSSSGFLPLFVLTAISLSSYPQFSRGGSHAAGLSSYPQFSRGGSHAAGLSSYPQFSRGGSHAAGHGSPGCFFDI